MADPKNDEPRSSRIVETRQSALSPHGSRRGILRPLAEGSAFRLERFQPQGDLRRFVDRFWSVRWDLRGREPYPQEVSVAAASLTGRVVPLRELFADEASASLERDVLSATRTADRVRALEAFLRARLPLRNAHAELAARATELALADREITSVEGLAARCDVSTRGLQRLFRRWVGVGPKWVIRRARVQEAAERVAAGNRVNWARLAGELGYFDQTHLIKDFLAQIGVSPEAYALACRAMGRS